MNHTLLIKIILALGLGLGIQSASVAVASAGDLTSVEPRIDRRPFQTMLDAIGVDEDQRVVIEMLYEDYLDTLEDLADRSENRIAAAGKDRVDNVLKRHQYLEPDELRRLRIAVAKAEAAMWPEAQDLAEALLLDSESMLPEGAVTAFRRAVRPVRLAMYLHPRRIGELDETYAGDGVDVNVLAEKAQRPGGELNGTDRGVVAGTLDEYTSQMEQFLLDTAAADRQGRADAMIGAIAGDDRAVKEALHASLVRWQRFHRLNRAAVERVGAIAFDSSGPEARKAWLERFDHACFPWMYRNTKPARQHAWIQRMVRDTTVKQKADAALALFRSEYDVACREAIDLMIHSRMVLGTIVHSKSNPMHLDDPAQRTIYEKLLRNSGRRAKLAADASAALETLITDGQRKQMRSDFNAGRG